MRMVFVSVEFRQKLACKRCLLFQALQVGDLLSIDPNPMYP
jgi:hypothetical protein